MVMFTNMVDTDDDGAVGAHVRDLLDVFEKLDRNVGGKVVALFNLNEPGAIVHGYRILTEKASDILEVYGDSACVLWTDGRDMRGTYATGDGRVECVFRVLRPEGPNVPVHDRFLKAAEEGRPVPDTLLVRHTMSLLPYVADRFGLEYGRRMPCREV